MHVSSTRSLWQPYLLGHVPVTVHKNKAYRSTVWLHTCKNITHHSNLYLTLLLASGRPASATCPDAEPPTRTTRKKEKRKGKRKPICPQPISPARWTTLRLFPTNQLAPVSLTPHARRTILCPLPTQGARPHPDEHEIRPAPRLASP